VGLKVPCEAMLKYNVMSMCVRRITACVHVSLLTHYM